MQKPCMPTLLLALVIAAAGVTEDPIFVDANRLFSELEFEQAAFRFEQLGLRGDLAAADRSLVLMWLGTCQAKAGDLENATRSYELALTFNPEQKAPVAVSPKVVRLIEAIRKVVLEKKKRENAGASTSTASTDIDTDVDDTTNASSDSGSTSTGNASIDSPSDDVPAGTKIEDGWDGGTNDTSNTSPDDVKNPADGTPDASTAADSPSPIGALAFPLAIAAGVVGAALVVGAGTGAIFSGLDLAASFDLKNTQTEATALYTRGLIIGGTSAAVALLAGGAVATSAGLLLVDIE